MYEINSGMYLLIIFLSRNGMERCKCCVCVYGAELSVCQDPAIGALILGFQYVSITIKVSQRLYGIPKPHSTGFLQHKCSMHVRKR